MRILGLTLLPFLLLAAQVFSAEGKKEVKDRRVSKATTPGKPQAEPRSQAPKYLTKGKFVTPDQADCRWVVTEKERGVVLKVDCARQEEKFSCFFAGNPTLCLQLNRKSYWKQIGRSLRSQKVICGDPKSILKTRGCRKKFPESNLKLVNSTLIGKKSSQESTGPSPSGPSVADDTSRLQPSKVEDSTLSGPSASMGSHEPECAEDPDEQIQNKIALDYCGESWSSFCKFFITMLHGFPC